MKINMVYNKKLKDILRSLVYINRLRKLCEDIYGTR